MKKILNEWLLRHLPDVIGRAQLDLDEIAEALSNRADLPRIPTRDDLDAATFTLLTSKKLSWESGKYAVTKPSPEPSQGPGPNRGAVAIIDALGFKGSWESGDGFDWRPLHTIREMAEATRERSHTLEAMANRLGAAFRRVKFQMNCFSLSDALVVTCYYPSHFCPSAEELEIDRTDVEGYMGKLDGLAVFSVCDAVSAALGRAMICPRPFNFRGTVAAGPMYVEAPLLLGPAVDCAGAYHEAADGAFVFLDESAARPPQALQPANRPWPQMVRRFHVPMKLKGESVTEERLVINPFFHLPDGASRRLTANEMLQTMSGETLRGKRENTERLWRVFLDAVVNR